MHDFISVSNFVRMEVNFFESAIISFSEVLAGVKIYPLSVSRRFMSESARDNKTDRLFVSPDMIRDAILRDESLLL